MKKLLFVALAAVLALSGCKKNASGDLLSRIKEKGEIVVATEGTWAPWTFHDESNKLVGFDVEVAQAIAEKLGVKAVSQKPNGTAFSQESTVAATTSPVMAWKSPMSAHKNTTFLRPTATSIPHSSSETIPQTSTILRI